MTRLALPKYERIPQVIGAAITTTAGLARMDEDAFRNAGADPMEIYGVGFSLSAAHASAASQSYADVGIGFRDESREMSWWQGSSQPRVSTLIDIQGNSAGESPGAADTYAFNGPIWRFRHPALLAPGASLETLLRNFVSETSVTLDVVLFGASLRTMPEDPRFDRIHARWNRSMPWQGLTSPWIDPIHRPFGPTPRRGWMPGTPGPDGVVAYESVPYVMTGTVSVTAGTATSMVGANFRNGTGFDFVPYEVGFSLGESLDGGPALNLDDVAVLITSLADRQPWQSGSLAASALVAYEGSRMTSAGGVWRGSKWDLGPGAVVPPGGELRVEITRTSANTLTLDVSVIGYLVVPIKAGSEMADALLRHCTAVPTRW